ncbi:MAG: acetate kinase [Desulfovibrio sp.]|nr:acetate kinase [Desulfovibrio sp.]
MKVLVVNAGSSSCKYQLIEMAGSSVKVLCAGLAERIGLDRGRLTHRIDPDGPAAEKIVRERPFPTHKEALELVVSLLTDPRKGVIRSRDELYAIGHRTVHGGEAITEPVLVDERVKQVLEDCTPLGPLHNPPNLAGIRVCEALFPGIPNVAVFDTEFGTAMPEESYMYALPYEYYERLGVRRYGFHGTSHKYVAKACAKYLGKPLRELNAITLHLGNGSSISCVKNGKCLDTSMGLSPLEGLVMGTRCGSIDPAIVPFIMQQDKLSPAEMDAVMNRNSGLGGACGFTDMRDVHAARAKGDRKADLAFRLFIHAIKKTLGSYFFELGGQVDAVTFTAGIGENDSITRQAVMEGLEAIGFRLDEQENRLHKPGPRTISAPGSLFPILVIPTNEELQIAESAIDVVSAQRTMGIGTKQLLNLRLAWASEDD